MTSSWVLLVLILISSIPVITVYVWFRLAKYPFSIIRFFIALLAGAAALFPALVLQNVLPFSVSANSRTALFYEFFIRIAFTEELSRLLMLFIFFFISAHIAKENSGQLASWGAVNKAAATGLVAGLGFAILESAVYAASNSGVLLLRAVTAAPLHGACGARIGAAAVMYRAHPVQATMRVFTAVAIHGIYNLMIVIPGFMSIAAVLISLTALASSVMVIRNNHNPEENP